VVDGASLGDSTDGGKNRSTWSIWISPVARVIFDLLFQPVAGHWRLFGISIATKNAPTAGAKENEKARAKKNEKEKKKTKSSEKVKK
jgi:hypothetical protein